MKKNPNDLLPSNAEIPSDPCDPNPCQNGGSCIREGSRVKCVCADGYTGRRCESGNYQALHVHHMNTH